MNQSSDTRYGASKRLYEDMERHDRQMLATAVSIVVMILIIIVCALWWVFV